MLGAVCDVPAKRQRDVDRLIGKDTNQILQVPCAGTHVRLAVDAIWVRRMAATPFLRALTLHGTL